MVCSICYASLFNADVDGDAASGSAGHRPSVLLCGHVFHVSCITDWFQASYRRNCPTCHGLQAGQPIVLYVDIDEEDLPTDPNAAAEAGCSASNEIVDNIVECLDRMTIGDWPSLQTIRGSGFKDGLIERLEALQAELAHHSSRNSELERVRSELTGKCGRLQIELDTQKNNCGRLEVDLATQKDQCEELESDITALKDSCAKLELDYTAAKDKCQSIEKFRNTLQARCKSLQKGSNTHKAKFDDSQKKLGEAEQKILDMSKSVVDQKAQLVKFQRKVGQLNAQIKSLKSHISSTQ